MSAGQLSVAYVDLDVVGRLCVQEVDDGDLPGTGTDCAQDVGHGDLADGAVLVQSHRLVADEQLGVGVEVCECLAEGLLEVGLVTVDAAGGGGIVGQGSAPGAVGSEQGAQSARLEAEHGFQCVDGLQRLGALGLAASTLPVAECGHAHVDALSLQAAAYPLQGQSAAPQSISEGEGEVRSVPR
ncbi:hypothetical protein LV779_36440 [Streptomyces thinghirensis]|nr:hypothetical protein [Streptomyces thinghirensis]